MYICRKKFEHFKIYPNHTRGYGIRQEKTAAADAAAQALLFPEGHAVGTLIHSRIGFMGTHKDPVQRAVVLAFAVVCALMDSTLDALVGMAVHNETLL